jgi:hypothetical protein
MRAKYSHPHSQRELSTVQLAIAKKRNVGGKRNVQVSEMRTSTQDPYVLLARCCTYIMIAASVGTYSSCVPCPPSTDNTSRSAQPCLPQAALRARVTLAQTMPARAIPGSSLSCLHRPMRHSPCSPCSPAQPSLCGTAQHSTATAQR